MAASALRELATTAPTDLLDGHRLQDTYRLLESAHLVPANNDDEIQMLHSLFNVAISHGIGRLVTDYLTEVCALGGARSASNHPHSPLTDPDCMRQWLRQSLATVRQQLTSLLSHGLASISGPGAVAPLVHQLGILNLVAQALKAHPGAPHHPSWPVSNINAASAGNELFLEAQRLSQCAAVLQWLGQVRLRLASPTGRFPSHEAWTTTVELRRSGVGSSRLFVDDFLDDLAQHDIEAGTYPPASPEALISALFLNSAPAQDALEPKLALLSYALVDANLLTAPEVSDSLMKSFSILPSTTQGWLLLLFLDDSQLVPSGEASANSSLAQAVNCIPGIKGSTLPFRALQVFLEKGRGDVALSLLRQRTNDGGGGSRGGASRRDGVAEACAALQVRLANGLLVEAFLEMKRHLGATPEGQRAQHAQQLMAELLNWGVQSQGLHGIIRLPVSPGHEETALVTTLQSDAATLPQAGLMLTLYYLLRGRTVEALTAYARFGRTCTAASAPELADAKAQLEGLLAASARLLPEAQRALVVASGPVPELRTGGEDGVEDAMEIGGGVSVATVVPGVEAPIMSPLLSVGPSPSEAPLVGGVTVMGVAQQAKQGGAHAAASGAPKPDQGSIAMPLLFGSQQAAPAAKPVAQPGSVFGQFGGGQLSGGPGFVGGGHELDKLLGVGAERKAHSIRRGRPMQL